MKIHVVKAGDTLFELAKKYNVNLDKLIAANPGLADPGKLEIGMKIKIPSGSVPITPEGMYAHTVKQGDTMWKLSKATGVPLKTLIDANPHITNPNILMTNQIVHIPKHSGANGTVAATATGTNPKANTAPIAGVTPKANTAPVAETPKANTAPVAETPKANTAPVAETPKANTAPVVETPKANTAPVAETPKAKPAPVVETPKAKPAPVAEAPKANVAPVVEAPKANVAPVLEAPKANVAPAVQKPASSKPVSSPAATSTKPTSALKPSQQTFPGKETMGIYHSEQLFMQMQIPAVEAFTDANSAPAVAGSSYKQGNSSFSPYSSPSPISYSADQTPDPSLFAASQPTAPYTASGGCGCQPNTPLAPYGYFQGDGGSPQGFYPWLQENSVMPQANTMLSPYATGGTENAMFSPYATGGTENAMFSPYATGGTENAMLSPYATGGTENAMLSPYATGGTENAMFSPYATGGTENAMLSPYAMGGTENAMLSPYATGGTENAMFSPYATGGTENAMLSPYATGGTENAMLSPYATGGTENAMLSPYATGGTENAMLSPYATGGTENAMFSPYATGGKENSAFSPYSAGMGNSPLSMSYPQYVAQSLQLQANNAYPGYSPLQAGVENAAFQPYAADHSKPELAQQAEAKPGFGASYGPRYPQAGWGGTSAWPLPGYPAGGGLFPSGVPGVYNPAAGPIPYPSGMYGSVGAAQPYRNEEETGSSPSLSEEGGESKSVRSKGSSKKSRSSKVTLHSLPRKNSKKIVKPVQRNNPWINDYV
ncbi:LysM peptidoglycan-binding domain-containing protein [Gorillibacterium sp. CAU 1737]|uniref:LysM peptidoglycan-binding domain-containing protein n=1 Tax=Gorillibacterium sp. CAU 1737 TaxID=3140362 RepID=UPI00326033E4